MVGLLCIGVGIFIFCINRTRFNAGWIQPVVGGMFALAGVQFIAASKGKVAAVIGGLIYLGFSALGFYAAFGPGSFDGGISFFPEAWNQKLGRTLFGGVACLTALLAVYVLRQAWKPSGKHEPTT